MIGVMVTMAFCLAGVQVTSGGGKECGADMYYDKAVDRCDHCQSICDMAGKDLNNPSNGIPECKSLCTAIIKGISPSGLERRLFAAGNRKPIPMAVGSMLFFQIMFAICVVLLFVIMLLLLWMCSTNAAMNNFHRTKNRSFNAFMEKNPESNPVG